MLCMALEFVSGCLCLGESGHWYSVECRRVELLWAGCDQGENVACVMGCAKVRGLPARQIKSGWFPADDVNWSTTAWSVVSLSR